ncbi:MULTISPECIES: glycogen debranching N-terminal domain-containing protein [Micromonospora]|uniref:Amylo-alpha-1,6-glucosidase n=1 Tax=Micromonospora solifontis TaxID=2487138 RepID=A0ABX9WL54_9ACTN|nr:MULTISPECIES: glycogen debranching N-terminal domain-containing protein [Micromonospora]NES14868.1 amylo-alpha-1,6-glucosidase [Micromonospora sp. PPF5-17B]NES35209.1 amylo-alpha-1,6-glucosidase [Micromonospora solifontis]NES55204.1 amylo-alpha-1,6-glucosidase [Micromonospora sp. PPF5-6]RNM01187.1 amylo-alpha-1,6-glucosidase [Micromonospora solifontis]
MKQELLHILAGNSFAMGDAQGDMEVNPYAPIGLWSFDTRFVSHWVLTVDGERLHALSRDELASFETRFVLVPGTATHYVDATASVIRHRSIDDSFNERITLLNHSSEPAEFTVRMEIGSDFADTAEIRQPAPRRPTVTADSVRRQLRLRYQRERFIRETLVTSTEPVEVDARGMTFRVRVAPNGEWHTDLHVVTIIQGAGGRDLRSGLETHRQHVRRDMRADLARWLDRAPQLVADRGSLGPAYTQALTDLAALRYLPLAYRERVPVGGLPWAMALYGRDAMITCLQTLPFTPELTPATLRLLALLQGGRLDDFHDEEPGKILAELRYGEAAAFGEQPTAVYYGAADTTPLFVVLLDEYERWTGDVELVRQLRHPARMALDWIDEYGDLCGDGYLRYQPRNRVNGVANQTWRNSPEAIVDRYGHEPAFPRATCELQGYAYDAKLRGARLARKFWDDPAYADRLEAEAARLRERFNRDFWLPHREYYAFALTPDGAPVDALTSGLGHLLFTGIVEPERADAVAAHLCGPDLFSGWGVRTYADRQRPYNPVGAHLGAVWPSDNALIAAGLRRYGYDREAAQIAAGMFGVVETLDGSVPEVIAGYPRTVTKYPVQLPAAGRPQSWASGGLLMLLATMLGLRPCGDNLLVDPAIPEGYGRIELLDVPGRWGRADSFGRAREAHRRPRLR